MKKQYFFLLLPFGRLQTIESLIICRRMALRICCLLTAVLHALFAENKLSMSELAKLIGRKKNTVTNLIATLEERGYCYRENDPHDGRSQLVFLTLKGEEFRSIQKNISKQLLKDAWEGTSKQDRSACLRGLQTMLANLQKSNNA